MKLTREETERILEWWHTYEDERYFVAADETLADKLQNYINELDDEERYE